MILALLLAAAASAAEPAFVSDPRIELLGVLQRLSGTRPDLPVDAEYARAVDKAFSRHKKEPAVSLYKELASGPGGEGLAVALLWYGEPPELSLRGLPSSPPYFGDDGKGLPRALAALRAFAAKTRFMDFYKAHAADYARARDGARAALGVDDPLARAQAYLGLPLETKARWLVSPLYVPSMRGSFIVPYPDPATLPEPGPAPFEAYTIVAWAPGAKTMGANVTQLHRTALWQEPLFVFVDPAMAAFDASLGVPPAKYYGADAAACRRQDADCVKSWLVGALAARLDAAAFGAPSMGPDGSDPRRERWVAALSKRLEEYEADRKRWPTLWDFLPRLLSVFPEKEGLKPPKPAARKSPATVKDLFPGKGK